MWFSGYDPDQYSSIAQSVEHAAVNRAVVGSSPTRGVWLLGQVVKTPPFHGGNMGSNPVGVMLWRRSQVVRQRSATPSSPVQIWSTPLKETKYLVSFWHLCLIEYRGVEQSGSSSGS